MSSERFTNDMINALRYSKMTGFRDKYRNMDVLLVDDIQFLVNKERTQEEFFHTFNALHECMRQIVIASDRPPKELAEIEDRLRSRFEWGLIADIQPPDLETKVAILQKKAEIGAGDAAHGRGAVHRLEHSQQRARVGRRADPPDRVLVADRRRDQPADRAGRPEEPDRLAGPQNHHRIDPESGVEQFGLRQAEIKAKNNSRVIVFPRQIAMYLAKHLTDASLPEIGRQFGGKHHTTVLHSVDKIETAREDRQGFKQGAQ